ncbi:MAG: lipoate--protein ligase [Clostridia bacterium]|nr:lipoate--protein ligase [Clostridia bacterium]
MSNYIHFSNSGDGHLNLAADGYFLENVKRGDVILYFYINSNAVIIGRNQNAWRECHVANLRRDGVQLVRRHTGGGAVYHDEGNINFSFIMNEKNYDLERQLRVISRAVEKLGVKTELSGRNDILVDGKKFSGNAYGFKNGNRGHHGTVLVNTDLSRLGEYLNVSAAKMRAKGVESVRSRVCNLTEFAPDATTETIRKYICEAFIEEYGEARPYAFESDELAEIEKRRKRQASWEWRFGKTPQFELNIENRFSFGELQLHLDLKEGRIRRIKAFSDCLDTELVSAIESALRSKRFEPDELARAVSRIDNKTASDEMSDFFMSKTFEKVD